MKRTVASLISQTLDAQMRCKKNGNTEWYAKHGETIEQLVKNHLPSGSGWDSGTKLDDVSTPEHLVFYGSYHHMNDNGMYDGWTDHVIHVRPSLAWGLDIKVTGRNRREIKDYLHEMFTDALRQEIEYGA